MKLRMHLLFFVPHLDKAPRYDCIDLGRKSDHCENERRCPVNMSEVRERAATAGLAGVSKLGKAELIRKIQQAEGNSPCFGADFRQNCSEVDCCWRGDCLKA